MTDTIRGRVFKRIEDILSDEEIDKLIKYIESDKHDEFDKFLKSKNIKIEKLYAEETLVYKAEMVNLIQGKKKEE